MEKFSKQDLHELSLIREAYTNGLLHAYDKILSFVAHGATAQDVVDELQKLVIRAQEREQQVYRAMDKAEGKE